MESGKKICAGLKVECGTLRSVERNQILETTLSTSRQKSAAMHEGRNPYVVRLPRHSDPINVCQLFKKCKNKSGLNLQEKLKERLFKTDGRTGWAGCTEGS